MLKGNILIKILLLIVCGSYSVVISSEILKPPFFEIKIYSNEAFVNTKKKLSMLKFLWGLAILFDLIWIKRETEKGRKERG